MPITQIWTTFPARFEPFTIEFRSDGFEYENEDILNESEGFKGLKLTYTMDTDCWTECDVILLVSSLCSEIPPYE